MTYPISRSRSVSITSEITSQKTKIGNAIEGLSSNCFNCLSNRVLPGSKGKENTLTICNYIDSIKSEIKPSDHYRKSTIINILRKH